MRRRPGRQEWKQIAGYEGLYEVSNKGLVWSLRRQIVLKAFPSGNGYLHVALHKDGRQKTRYIHKMVAAAFIGRCPAGMEVLHGDGDQTNNHRTNLRYGTHAENVQESVKHGTHASTRKTRCPKNHPLDGRHKNGKRYCKQCNRDRRLAYYEAHKEAEKQKMREQYQRRIAA
jgi:hypothetical protein